MIAPRKNGSRSHKRQQMDHKPIANPRNCDSLNVGRWVRMGMPSNEN